MWANGLFAWRNVFHEMTQTIYQTQSFVFTSPLCWHKQFISYFSLYINVPQEHVLNVASDNLSPKIFMRKVSRPFARHVGVGEVEAYLKLGTK